MPVIRPFLMFQGRAEEALNLYVSLFPGSLITNIVRYGPAGPGAEGSVMRADFSLSGQSVVCIDSPVKHEFAFTPAFSFLVDCQTAEELSRLFTALADGGMELMPLDNYGFSQKFGWLNDRFGVSWQLNLE
jgi:predicted 3-demethylubiquinone-9 3-methyltransferase (glyoxalase superfamily)